MSVICEKSDVDVQKAHKSLRQNSYHSQHKHKQEINHLVDMTYWLVQLKQKYGFPLGIVNQFNNFPLWIWLVDNSGSMMFTDGKK